MSGDNPKPTISRPGRGQGPNDLTSQNIVGIRRYRCTCRCHELISDNITGLRRPKCDCPCHGEDRQQR
jgi:hypothetical protein